MLDRVTLPDILRGLTALGLPGCDCPMPTEPLDDDRWVELRAAVNRERMWGLLGWAVAGGHLPASSQQAAEAERSHRRAMEDVLELEALAIATADLLASAGIGSRALKGLAVAHLDEPDPSLRCFNDVDLLVPGDRLPESIEALTREGFARDLPERRPGFDRRFAKEATMAAATGREVDLHRTLAAGVFGLSIHLDDLWATSSSIVVAGRELLTLGAEERLLNALYSAVLGDPEPRLVLLRDIGLLINRVDLDQTRVVELANAWNGASVVATGLTVAARHLGAREWPLLEWSRSFHAPLWSRIGLHSYASEGGSNTRTLLSGVMAPMSLGARVAYLRAMILPGRRYVIARREAGRPSELSTGLRELLHRSR